MALQGSTLSLIGRRPSEAASIESRIGVVDINNLVGHHADDLDSELRLDDVSRRSACDRCRGMKMRCERPHRQYISQLQQCRRCNQANARCITTLEAERRDISLDKPTTQRSRKRRRQNSIQANGGRLPVAPHALGGRLDEQQQHHEHDMSTPSPFEHAPEHTIMTEMMQTSPSVHAGSRPDDGILTSLQDIQYQLPVLDWDGSGTIYGLGGDHHDQSGAISVPRSASYNATCILTLGPEDGGTYTEATTASSAAAAMQSTSGPPSSQGSHGLGGNNSLPTLSSPPLPDDTTHTSPQTQVCLSMMNKVMEFNIKVSKDLDSLKEENRARGDENGTGVLMVKTLQYSDMILELLSTLTCGNPGPGESPDRQHGASSSPCSLGRGCSYRHHHHHHQQANTATTTANSDSRGEKVDTDMALLLLSFSMKVTNLYELLCMDLTRLLLTTEHNNQNTTHAATTAHPGNNSSGLVHFVKAQLLSFFGMEGLQTLDTEMRLQVLVHICLLKFTKIQKELELIRGLGVLTETADKVFQVVLGNSAAANDGNTSRTPAGGGDDSCSSTAAIFGIEQMVDQLCRRVMNKTGVRGTSLC